MWKWPLYVWTSLATEWLQVASTVSLSYQKTDAWLYKFLIGLFHNLLVSVSLFLVNRGLLKFLACKWIFHMNRKKRINNKCLTVDDLWLAGSIKVWDFGSGQVIKKKSGRHSDEDLSVVGMAYTYFQGDRVLLAVGWNNKIRMLLVIFLYGKMYLICSWYN